MNARLLHLNEQLVAIVASHASKILKSDPTLDGVLYLANQSYAWADSLIERFETDNPLPQPIACKPGCDFCCHNQIEATPLEALSIGNFLQALPVADRAGLQNRIKVSVARRTGKTKQEIALLRREFPCPLLSQGLCAVYPVRPLLCRAMHSLDVRRCEQALREENLSPDRYYLHRDEIVRSIIKGLADGCRAMGFQTLPLDLAQAMDLFLAQPERVTHTWLWGTELL